MVLYFFALAILALQGAALGTTPAVPRDIKALLGTHFTPINPGKARNWPRLKSADAVCSSLGITLLDPYQGDDADLACLLLGLQPYTAVNPMDTVLGSVLQGCLGFSGTSAWVAGSCTAFGVLPFTTFLRACDNFFPVACTAQPPTPAITATLQGATTTTTTLTTFSVSTDIFTQVSLTTRTTSISSVLTPSSVSTDVISTRTQAVTSRTTQTTSVVTVVTSSIIAGVTTVTVTDIIPVTTVVTATQTVTSVATSTNFRTSTRFVPTITTTTSCPNTSVSTITTRSTTTVPVTLTSTVSCPSTITRTRQSTRVKQCLTTRTVTSSSQTSLLPSNRCEQIKQNIQTCPFILSDLAVVLTPVRAGVEAICACNALGLVPANLDVLSRSDAFIMARRCLGQMALLRIGSYLGSPDGCPVIDTAASWEEMRIVASDCEQRLPVLCAPPPANANK